MVLLATSASGANVAGYGELLAFGEDGDPLGAFSEDDRIVDPRGVGIGGALLFRPGSRDWLQEAAWPALRTGPQSLLRGSR